ncbi:AAA family ATPase [Lysobacter soli]|uniref:AAA family ATPase n=1 Tax=Lysobacter soli TaxID=453783 RepID=UPI0036B9ACD7
MNVSKQPSIQLKRIEVKRLYGTFSKSVDFDPVLNLLVGINGSGKTSILNCIDWLLKPDLPKLAATKFQSIRLTFELNGRPCSLIARHEAGQLVVEDEARMLGANAITVDILRPIDTIHSERDFSEACQLYSGLNPEPHERSLWKALHTLPRPLAISLDRTITAEADEQVFFDDAGRRRIAKIAVKSPLEKVLDVTSARFAAYRERVSSLNDALKARIVSSAFNNPFSVSDDIKRESDISLDEIARLEGKVTSLLTTMDADSYAAKNVARYFRDAKQLASHAMGDKNMRVIFSVQFKQINELTVAFNEYERKASAAFEPIRSYLAAVNSFFRESRKQLGFNESDGRLSVQFLNANGAATGQHLGVDRLSSGEKQVLILLTFLAFVSSRDQVFVVDEPELSLHPRWQESFLDAILSQSPAGTQIVLATHSPEIVARHREKCILLDA